MRPTAAPLGATTPRDHLQPGFEFEALPDGTIEVVTPNKGMYSTVGRREIPPEAFLEIQNGRLEFDGTRRRDGTREYGAKPNSNPLLSVGSFINDAGDPYLFRVDTGSIYISPGESVYTICTDTDAVMTGVTARLDHDIFIDKLYFAGHPSGIFRVNPTTFKVEKITAAPKGRYITSWADRIIVANIGLHSYRLAWSANANPTDWTDISSGEENLIQAPSQLGDEITGLFGTEQELIILRRNSIWHAARQPFAAAPFRFRPVVSGIGCDLPSTAVRVPGGIIFASREHKGVFFYAPGSMPQRISPQIDDDFLADLARAKWCDGGYHPQRMEYHLGVSTNASTLYMEKVWIYSIRRQGWVYDDGLTLSALGTAISANPTMIDDLVGFIDDLGSLPIDQLASDIHVSSIFMGTSTGEIITYDETEDDDWNGTDFEFVVESQDFGSISRRRTMKNLLVHVSATRAGTALLSQSKDRATWRNEKTDTVSLGRGKISLLKTQTTGDSLFWRLRASSSDVRIRSYWMEFLEKGLQHG